MSLFMTYLPPSIALDLNVDPATILHSSHGRRSIDTVALYDPSKANWAYVSHMEGQLPVLYGASAIEVPGSRALLDALAALAAPWTVVTSGTDALMSGWLKVMELPRPEHAVTAEDVKQGKPDPECYALGRERIGLGERSRVMVFEDAPAGVSAGKAAGCVVLGLATTHEIGRVRGAGADYVVKDLRSVSVKAGANGGFEVELRDVWRDRV